MDGIWFDIRRVEDLISSAQVVKQCKTAFETARVQNKALGATALRRLMLKLQISLIGFL
jgi:hypothetical protein